MKMFLGKSDDGYLRFREEGRYELVGMDKASVYLNKDQCIEKMNSIDSTKIPKNLRLAKLTITESDWIG